MLANSFLKPEALGISEKEVAALVCVLGMLERGELEYCEKTELMFSGIEMPNWPKNGFNMGMFGACGTVRCIGGWVATLIGADAYDYVSGADGKGKLFQLYWPNGGVMDSITTAQAALALRNYLTTGEPRWAEAIAE